MPSGGSDATKHFIEHVGARDRRALVLQAVLEGEGEGEAVEAPAECPSQPRSWPLGFLPKADRDGKKAFETIETPKRGMCVMTVCDVSFGTAEEASMKPHRILCYTSSHRRLPGCWASQSLISPPTQQSLTAGSSSCSNCLRPFLRRCSIAFMSLGDTVRAFTWKL